MTSLKEIILTFPLMTPQKITHPKEIFYSLGVAEILLKVIMPKVVISYETTFINLQKQLYFHQQ
ncbi:hypothetical protein M621_08235 [Serratia plymuthica S13]|uniref:Uncharacterized protein n=1 Tax=Serratia plymuthica S13 TaxID=1348660 RepID=S4YNS3_SERPL|nr:hypothetical protein M621_08235 [Serratia plymuthica S13]